MRKSLLLLLTLTFTWFGAKSNTLVAAANTADPIVEQAYKSVFSSLNASTAFGKFVRGVIMADTAPGCPTDIIVSQLSNTTSCTVDVIVWTEPTPEAAVTTPTDTLFINLTTGDTAIGLDLSAAQLLNLEVGEYRVEYHYDVATQTSSTDGVCNVLLTVIDNMKPSIDINNTSIALNDTISAFTTSTTCATPKSGVNRVNLSDIFRPLVLDDCDNSSLVSFEVTNASGIVIANDDTLTMAEGNLFGSINGGLNFTLGFNHINFTAYDLNGNMSTKSIVVHVVDIVSPIFSDTIAISNTNIGVDSLSTDLGSDSKAIAYLIPGATDNCAIITYSFVISGDTSITGTGNNINASLMVGTYTVDYTVTDASGNLETLSHNIVVSDNEAPTVVCPNDEFTGPFYVSSSCEFDFETESVAGKDNFSNDLTNHWEVLDTDTLTLISAGTKNNTFGNITASIITPGRYAVRQWVTDNTFGVSTAGFSSDTCIAFFSVLDTITPVLDSKPLNVSINITANCDTVFAPNAPNVTENCTLDSTSYLITNNINGDTLYFAESAASVLTFPATIDSTDNVVYTYSFYFADKSGNEVSYAYNIFVNDTIVPTINTNIFAGQTSNETTVNTNASCNVSFTLPTSFLNVNDNCNVASVKIGADEIYDVNNQTTLDQTVILNDTLNVFFFTVTDYSGNSVTDSIIVKKVDDDKPLLNGGTPYANIDEYNSANSCDYVYSISNLNNLLQVTDNCGIDSVLITIALDTIHTSIAVDTTIRISQAELMNPFSFNFSASQLNDGNNSQVHLVSIMAKDITGNASDISSFSVTVHDSIEPQIFLDDSVVYYVNGNDCNSVTILSTDSRADIFGNQLGTVFDNCASDARLLSNMVNDNPASALVGDSLFGNFPLGSTLVTFTTNDGNNNFFSQSIKVIVVDTIAPNSVVSVINTITNDTTCTATLTINSPVSISDDNCGVDSVEYSLDGITYIGLDSLNASFESTFALDTTTVFWKSYDESGNSVEFSTLVIIRDIFRPTLELSSNLNYFTTATECAASFTLPAAVVTENCGIDSVVSVLRTVQGALDVTKRFVNTPVVIDFLPVHFDSVVTYTLTTTAYDVNGNVSDDLINFITYSDTIVPIINAIDTIFLKTDSLLCTTAISLDSLGTAYGLNISDNCGINTILYNFLNTSGSFTDTSFAAAAGTYDFVVNVLDNSTNFAKRAFTIVVESTFEDKVLSAPADTVFTNAFANECSKNVFFDSLEINTCNIRYAYVSSKASGSLFEIGNTNVAWYVIDQGDTLFTYNFVVSVIDNQDPVIKQAPQDITLYANNNCSVQYNYVLDVQDNCDAQGLTVVTSVPSGSILGVGTYTNTYSVADESGNTITGSNIVTVLDTLNPSFSAFPGNIVSCDPVVDFTVTGTDNCSGAVVVLESGLASGETFNLGTTTVTYSITDASGNSVTKSFTVEILPQATAANAGTDAIICITDTAFVLDGNTLVNGETGTWTVNSPDATIAEINNPTSGVLFTAAGNYTFTWMVDNNQCAPNSDQVFVTVSKESIVDAGADFTTNEINAQLDGFTENGTSVWSTNSVATIVSPAKDRTMVNGLVEGDNVFVLTVNNATCGNVSDTVVITLTVEVVEEVAFRDNIVAGFTPNGDGVNDTWTLPGIENFPGATVKIFNRWGSIVFETSNPATEAWDGTNEGTELPVASYYYVIDLGDGSKEVSGIVSIIK